LISCTFQIKEDICYRSTNKGDTWSQEWKWCRMTSKTKENKKEKRAINNRKAGYN
jgi:hypothetical protein